MARSRSATHTTDAAQAQPARGPRYRVAVAYVVLAAAVTAEVVLQGFLFSVFYARTDSGFLTAHGIAGELTSYLVVVVLAPLAFLARFPSGGRIAWWTVVLAALWSVQAHVLGYGIEQIGRWLATVHIPVAFAVLLLSLHLTNRARVELGAMTR